MANAIKPGDDRRKFRESLQIKDTDIVLITVGRFSYSKAQRYTIEVFAALQKKYDNLKLLLIGEGELLASCIELSKKLGIKENSIHFLGFQRNVAQYISISDIFIFTSLREGLPRVIVEASLLEVPVVTFQVEGASEVIENEKTGFIVPQKDQKALMYYTEQLILQPELRSRFGKLSREHVIKYWDMHLMANQLQKIYNQK